MIIFDVGILPSKLDPPNASVISDLIVTLVLSVTDVFSPPP